MNQMKISILCVFWRLHEIIIPWKKEGIDIWTNILINIDQPFVFTTVNRMKTQMNQMIGRYFLECENSMCFNGTFTLIESVNHHKCMCKFVIIRLDLFSGTQLLKKHRPMLFLSFFFNQRVLRNHNFQWNQVCETNN